MAYNVEIDVNFMPVREMDEQFVMRRDGVEHHVHIRGMGEFKGKGHVVLTTRRLVIVNRDFTLFPEFKSISFPLRETHDESFEQGMAGRFHVHAKVRPNGAHFKLWFDMGGAFVFQHYYKRCLIRAKEGLGADAMMMEFRAAQFQNEVMGFGDMGRETTVYVMGDGQVAVVQQEPVRMEQPMMMNNNQMAAGMIGTQLDAPLDGEMMPMKEADEEFVMRRNGIVFHVHVNREGEYKGEGHLILTTKRLVLVNRGFTIFKSFSMPLVHIHAEQFRQGDLGKFHVEGKCKPGMLNIKHPSEFNIKFDQLGAIHFQEVFRTCIIRAKEQRDAQAMMMELRGPEFQARFMGFGDMGGETMVYIQPDGQVDVVQRQPMMAPIQEAVAVQRMDNAIMVDCLMLDAPLDGDFMPVKDMNEEFLLRRNFIEFHIHIRDRGDFRGKGHLVLTTKRLVLVNRENPEWRSWSLPLFHTFDERFEEGMGGRFHIDAHCRNQGAVFNHPAHFKVWFNQGGALRFQHIYKRALIRNKERVEFGLMMNEFRGPVFIAEVNGFPMQQEETIFFIDGVPVAVAPVQRPVEVVVQEPVMMAPVAVATAVAVTECVMLRDPLIGPDGMPIREGDEEFVMRRNGVEFHIHIKGVGHLKAKHGHAVLTTKRLVLVNRDPAEFKSFQFPLVHTHKEEFKPGVRGRFHMEAHCKPMRSLFNHPGEFKLWCNEGGAIIFQEVYKRLLIRAKEQRDAAAIMMELRGPQFQGELGRYGAYGEETVLYIKPDGQVVVAEVQVAPVIGNKKAQRMEKAAAAAQLMQPQQKGCCTIF